MYKCGKNIIQISKKHKLQIFYLWGTRTCKVHSVTAVNHKPRQLIATWSADMAN